MHAGRIPEGRLLFTTQIPENLTANFRVFSRKKWGQPWSLRPSDQCMADMLSALTIAPNKLIDGAFDLC